MESNYVKFITFPAKIPIIIKILSNIPFHLESE